MRKAFNNVQVIGEGDIFYGVSLGYDFCAEHEWGIEKLRNHFGIDNKKMGAEGRKITKGEVFFAEDDTMCVLTSRKPWMDKKDNFTTKELLASDIRHFSKDIETAWDEGDFCIATQNKEFFKYLHTLYHHFQDKNILICFLSSKIPVFENASLSVLICDILPKEITDAMYTADKKSVDLYEYEKEIGVTALKEKSKGAGYKGEKYFMACSPRWIDYEDPENREKRKKELGTKYDITFWINYSDDDDNYGWYTAEQIIQWLSTPGLKLKSLNKKEK